MALLRRKRNADGSFGELEKVFKGETQEEMIQRLEKENQELNLQLVESNMELYQVIATLQVQNEMQQAEMFMEILSVLETLQGGEDDEIL